MFIKLINECTCNLNIGQRQSNYYIYIYLISAKIGAFNKREYVICSFAGYVRVRIQSVVKEGGKFLSL